MSDTSVLTLNTGIVEPAKPQRPPSSRRVPAKFDLPENEAAPTKLIAPRIGHSGPPMLTPGDVLNGGMEIQIFLSELLGREPKLSTVYYWLERGHVPARKFGVNWIASKCGIAQTLAIGTGLVADAPAASTQA